jgi:hypothetical protein
MRMTSRPNRVSMRRVEPGCDLVQIIGEEGGIHVERHARGGVTEHALDHFDVGTGAHGKTGGSVAQVVRGQRLETDRSNGRVEDVAPKIRVVEQSTVAVGEDQISGACGPLAGR